MSSFFHHLEALGWAWVGLFAVLDFIALAGAALAIAGRRRTLALWALLGCVCATFASMVMTATMTSIGLATAHAIPGSSADPAQKARLLAEAISEAMNGAALGIAATLIAGVSALACLVAALSYRAKPSSSASQSPELR